MPTKRNKPEGTFSKLRQVNLLVGRSIAGIAASREGEGNHFFDSGGNCFVIRSENSRYGMRYRPIMIVAKFTRAMCREMKPWFSPILVTIFPALFVMLATVPSMAATISLKEIREAQVIIQRWDTSCAAAAMATVFTFTFNDPVSEREVAGGLLRQTQPVKVRHRGGFSMLDMKHYAAERGYRGIGFRGLSLEDIRYFDAPIVPLQIHGYNHYVVYRGVTLEGKVHIADPAYGNRMLSQERFEAAWVDGIAFVMARGTQ